MARVAQQPSSEILRKLAPTRAATQATGFAAAPHVVTKSDAEPLRGATHTEVHRMAVATPTPPVKIGSQLRAHSAAKNARGENQSHPSPLPIMVLPAIHSTLNATLLVPFKSSPAFRSNAKLEPRAGNLTPQAAGTPAPAKT